METISVTCHPARQPAANLGGRAVEVAGLSPVAVACSPNDSTLAYIDAGDHKLWSVRSARTADMLHLNGAKTILADGLFGNYVNCVRSSGQYKRESRAAQCRGNVLTEPVYDTELPCSRVY